MVGNDDWGKFSQRRFCKKSDEKANNFAKSEHHQNTATTHINRALYLYETFVKVQLNEGFAGYTIHLQTENNLQ